MTATSRAVRRRRRAGYCQVDRSVIDRIATRCSGRCSRPFGSARSGYHEFPPIGRGRVSRHRLGAKAFLCHGDFPDHANAAANPALDSSGGSARGPLGENPWAADHRSCRRKIITWPSTTTSLWSSYLRHTAVQGGGARPWPDRLCGDESSRRPDAGHDGARPSLVVAPLSHGAGMHQLVQAARGVPPPVALGKFDIAERSADRGAPRQQHFYRADHPEDDGRASRGRQVRSFLAALHDLRRRADVREDQKAALNKLGPVLVQYFGLGEVTGNITVMPANLHSRGRPAGPHRHLRLERTGMQV